MIRQKVWSEKILLLLFPSSGDCWDCVCAQVALARVHTREVRSRHKTSFCDNDNNMTWKLSFLWHAHFYQHLILSNARLVQQLLTRVNDLSSNDFRYFVILRSILIVETRSIPLLLKSLSFYTQLHFKIYLYLFEAIYRYFTFTFIHILIFQIIVRLKKYWYT